MCTCSLHTQTHTLKPIEMISSKSAFSASTLLFYRFFPTIWSLFRAIHFIHTLVIWRLWLHIFLLCLYVSLNHAEVHFNNFHCLSSAFFFDKLNFPTNRKNEALTGFKCNFDSYPYFFHCAILLMSCNAFDNFVFAHILCDVNTRKLHLVCSGAHWMASDTNDCHQVNERKREREEEETKWENIASSICELLVRPHEHDEQIQLNILFCPAVTWISLH